MSYEFEDGYKIRNQAGLHFLTFTIVGWIDLLSRKTYRDILLKNMLFCRTAKGLRIGAYVIMTNHVHVIWQGENNNLSNIIRDYKSFCTKEMIKEIMQEPESRKEWLLYMFQFYANRSNRNKDFKIWTNNNHPEEIFSTDFMRSKLDYIHMNPVRAGWVEKPEDYLIQAQATITWAKEFLKWIIWCKILKNKSVIVAEDDKINVRSEDASHSNKQQYKIHINSYRHGSNTNIIQKHCAGKMEQTSVDYCRSVQR